MSADQPAAYWEERREAERERLRKEHGVSIVLTKDLPAYYTKGGLEEILYGLEELVRVASADPEWAGLQKPMDAYLRWYENEQKRNSG